MIPKWTRDGELIRFDSLDNCEVPVLALGFRIKDQTDEKWTRRFNDFKYQEWGSGERAVRGACAAMPAALATINFESPVALVCAISASEEALKKGAPLARLGEAIGKAMGWEWLPTALKKVKHRRLIDLPAGFERDSEVQGKYQSASLNAKTVLVLDDFATRGSTIADVARAVLETGEIERVLGLVLGKNETAAYASGVGVTISNEHISKALDELWVDGA